MCLDIQVVTNIMPKSLPILWNHDKKLGHIFFYYYMPYFKPDYNILNYTQSWWGAMVTSHHKLMVQYFVNDIKKGRAKPLLVFFPLFCHNIYLKL
jgi:hypothetical protein